MKKCLNLCPFKFIYANFVIISIFEFKTSIIMLFKIKVSYSK